MQRITLLLILTLTILIISVEKMIFKPDPNLEFVCPDLEGDAYPFVELMYCESICLNRGCSRLGTCEVYQKAKAKELERTQKDKSTPNGNKTEITEP